MTIHSVPLLCNEAYSLRKAKCDPPQDFNNNNNNNNNDDDNNNNIFNQGKSVCLSCYIWVPWATKKLTIKGKNNYNGSLSEKCKNYVQCRWIKLRIIASRRAWAEPHS